MADSSVHLQVERWVVADALPHVFGQAFSKQKLDLEWGGQFEFDGVSRDGSIAVSVSTSAAKTSSGKNAIGKVLKIRADALYLLHVVGPQRRVLAFTDESMLTRFETEKRAGRFPPEIELLHVQLPAVLAANLAVAQRAASDEVQPQTRQDPLLEPDTRASSPPGTNVAGRSIAKAMGDQVLTENRVHVCFTDIGGLSVGANPWLEDLVAPLWLRLFGPTTVDVTLTPFARQYRPRQFKVGPPTIRQLMRLWNGPNPLSGADPYEVDGEILFGPLGPGNRSEDS